MPSCSTKYGALLSVVISGTVKESMLPHVKKGDALTISLLAEPKAIVRDTPGQGITHDGIAPFKVCMETFEVSFPSGVGAHFLKPPEAPVVPGVPTPDAPGGGKPGLYFSLMKGRVVYDGAFVSTEPADGAKGVPLEIPGDTLSKYGGFFDVLFDRHTVPSLEPAEAEYDSSAVHKAKLQIWKDWEAHIVVSADFDKMTITKAPEVDKDTEL